MTSIEQNKPRFEVVSENPTPQSGNVFDNLEALRQAAKPTIKRQGVLVNVAVDRPPSSSHFRAHPEWFLEGQTIVKDGETGTYYFVTPSMRPHPKLKSRLRLVTLAVVAVWPADVIYIWPVPELGGGKKDFKPWKSARVAYELSREKWTQISWADEESDFKVEAAEGNLPDPNWPTDQSFSSLLKLGFGEEGIIDSEDRDYVRQLRGLIG
jgi:hypothetical protein